MTGEVTARSWVPLRGYGRNFRLYALGQAVSVGGDRIALITLVFLVTHLAGNDGFALAGFYVARVLPTLLGGLFVGVLVDTMDRRALMLACDVGRAVLLVAAPGLAALNLWALYPVVFLLYGMTLVFNTAARAALPDTLPELKLMGANAILNGIQNASDFAYLAGGALIVLLGYRLPFYIDAATFAFSALMIYFMRLPEHRKESKFDPAEARNRIRSGFDFIGSNPFLRWSLVAFAIAPLAGGAGYVLAPVYATTTLASGSGLTGPLRNAAFRFSVLEVGLGVGALAGSALAPFLARRVPRGRLFGAALVGTGAFDALLSTTSNLYVAVAFLAVSGLFSSVYIVSGMTLVQTLTPTEVRGRVGAARVTLINGMLLVGSSLAGLALLAVPVRALWLAEGSLIVLASLPVWLRSEVRNQR